MTICARFVVCSFALSAALGAPLPAAAQPAATQPGDVDFGDNASDFSNDGKCDDMRFSGDAMAVFLIEEDILHDADDCRTAFDDGKLIYQGPQGVRTMTGERPDISAIDFGDDASTWANDSECDDRRFRGPGMTLTTLVDSDVGHDASDCSSAYAAGKLGFVGGDFPISENYSAGDATNDGADHSGGKSSIASDASHIVFGDDEGNYARDGECDDMRFEGSGMTQTLLIEADVKHDATDCRVAFEQGRITLRE